MDSRNYVFIPRKSSEEERAQMREWTQPLYDILQKIMQHLQWKEDPSKILFVCDAEGTVTANQMHMAHELRHEFMELMRERIRAAPATPRYAVFQSVMYRNNLMAPNARPDEEVVWHLETPDNLACAFSAKIIRTRKQPPRLDSPRYEYYDAVEKIQGGMCGFFLPRSSAFGEYGPPMPPINYRSQ